MIKTARVRQAAKGRWGKRKRVLNGAIILPDSWVGVNVVVMKRNFYNRLLVKINQNKRLISKARNILRND